MSDFVILHASDDSVLISFREAIEPQIASKVRAAADAIRGLGLEWVSDIIPAYRELLVVYDLRKKSPSEALYAIKAVMQSEATYNAPGPSLVRIPVCYGGVYGPDIEFVCNHTGLFEDELVRIHSSTNYLTYMIGFTIGFPYLGGMDERIAVPRLVSPREKTPAGSVGIAGMQTGIYTLQTPGGWQIIGRSPVRLVDVTMKPPAILSAGDYVRFYPIDEVEFIRISDLSKSSSYVLSKSPYEEGVL